MPITAKNLLEPSHERLDVAVLVCDDCNTLSFAAAVDPMRAANRLAGRTLFDWHYVTPDGRPALLTSGLEVPGSALARLETTDLLITVAGFQLARHATPALGASLRRIAATGATLAGIDGGPWLLAEAGLLDGHMATTHWEDLDAFAARFPNVTVVGDRFHLSGNRMTSGGATPAIEMMLSLIAARLGPRFAADVSGLFLYDRTPGPTRPQSRTGPPVSHSKTTARASRIMERHVTEPLSLAEIARRMGSSPRNLQAQFRQYLATTPQAHYLRLRLSDAWRLVTETDLSLTDVALATGFASQSSFARAFRRAYGTSARDLRKQKTMPQERHRS